MKTFLPAAALVLALGAPAGAELHEGVPPTQPAQPAVPAVVVRTDGGIAGIHRWTWFSADGIARYEGVLGVEHGTYRAPVDFARIQEVIDADGLCTRPAATVHPPAGNDMIYQSLSVSCPDGWHTFRGAEATLPATYAQVRHAISSFARIAATLAWKPTDEHIVLPDARALHTATATGH